MESVGFFVSGQSFPVMSYESMYPQYHASEDLSPQASPAAQGHPASFYQEYSASYHHSSVAETSIYPGPSTPQEISSYFFNTNLSNPHSHNVPPTSTSIYQHEPSNSSVATPPLTPKTPQIINDDSSPSSYPTFEEDEIREVITTSDGIVRVVVQRKQTNKKERRRTQCINSAFSSLRDCIPNVPADTKLSKIKTLRLATSYISYLMDLLKAPQDKSYKLLHDGFRADLTSTKRSSLQNRIETQNEIRRHLQIQLEKARMKRLNAGTNQRKRNSAGKKSQQRSPHNIEPLFHSQQEVTYTPNNVKQEVEFTGDVEQEACGEAFDRVSAIVNNDDATDSWKLSTHSHIHHKNEAHPLLPSYNFNHYSENFNKFSSTCNIEQID